MAMLSEREGGKPASLPALLYHEILPLRLEPAETAGLSQAGLSDPLRYALNGPHLGLPRTTLGDVGLGYDANQPLVAV